MAVVHGVVAATPSVGRGCGELRQRGAADVERFLSGSTAAGTELPAQFVRVEFHLETAAQHGEVVGHERRLAHIRAVVGSDDRPEEHRSSGAIGDDRRGEVQRPEVGIVEPVDAGVRQRREQVSRSCLRISEARTSARSEGTALPSIR